MALTVDSFQAKDLLIAGSDRPLTQAFPITKSDTDFLADDDDNPRPVRAIMVNVAGDVVVTLAGQSDEEAVTLKLAASTIYYIAVKKVWSTSTTATGIHGFI